MTEGEVSASKTESTEYVERIKTRGKNERMKSLVWVCQGGVRMYGCEGAWKEDIVFGEEDVVCRRRNIWYV